MVKGITGEDQQEDCQAHDKGNYVSILVHIEAVLIDLCISRRSHLRQVVLCKVIADEAYIAQATQEDVANEYKEEAQEQISIILFRLCSGPHDWDRAGVQVVTHPKDACKRREVGVEENQSSLIGRPVGVHGVLGSSNTEISVCKSHNARVDDKHDKHEHKYNTNAANLHEDGQIFLTADDG